MKRDHIEFQDRSLPLAYLITFRTFGTWLHGDDRGSMDRREYNRYGEMKLAPSVLAERRDRNLMVSPAFALDTMARAVVDQTVREVLQVRGCPLFALNVRTNHVHVVPAAAGTPESLMTSFKSYSTRRLRALARVSPTQKIWSRHGSTRYLWTEKHVETAVDYVVYGQGAELPIFD